LGGNLELLWRTRATVTWHQSVGHKGTVLRPRCFGTQRVKGKGKGKVHPRTGHEGPEGEDV